MQGETATARLKSILDLKQNGYRDNLFGFGVTFSFPCGSTTPMTLATTVELQVLSHNIYVGFDLLAFFFMFYFMILFSNMYRQLALSL